jgi:hypothetical protein
MLSNRLHGLSFPFAELASSSLTFSEADEGLVHLLSRFVSHIYYHLRHRKQLPVVVSLAWPVESPTQGERRARRNVSPALMREVSRVYCCRAEQDNGFCEL